MSLYSRSIQTHHKIVLYGRIRTRHVDARRNTSLLLDHMMFRAFNDYFGVFEIIVRVISNELLTPSGGPRLYFYMGQNFKWV